MIHPINVNDRIAQTLKSVAKSAADIAENDRISDGAYAKMLAAYVTQLAGICQEQQKRIEALEGEVVMMGPSK